MLSVQILKIKEIKQYSICTKTPNGEELNLRKE
jgi:hypothetical protein